MKNIRIHKTTLIIITPSIQKNMKSHVVRFLNLIFIFSYLTGNSVIFQVLLCAFFWLNEWRKHKVDFYYLTEDRWSFYWICGIIFYSIFAFTEPTLTSRVYLKKISLLWKTAKLFATQFFAYKTSYNPILRAER